MKRGRPKKVGPISDSELHIRMTRKEKEELRKKALEKNTTISNYIKSILFDQTDLEGGK